MSIENPSFILVDPSVWKDDDDIEKFIQDQQAVKTKYAKNMDVIPSWSIAKQSMNIEHQRWFELTYWTLFYVNSLLM